MTPWRAEQLWQLYLIVHGELTRELESERVEAATDAISRRLSDALSAHALARRDRAPHRARRGKPERSGVAVDLQRLDAAWQLTLVAPDRPGLFASAAGIALQLRDEHPAGRGIRQPPRPGARHLHVRRPAPHARAESHRSRPPARRSPNARSPARWTSRELLRNRPKPPLPSRKARIAGRVSFDAAASQTATLVQIVAEDRPGLLVRPGLGDLRLRARISRWS